MNCSKIGKHLRKAYIFLALKSIVTNKIIFQKSMKRMENYFLNVLFIYYMLQNMQPAVTIIICVMIHGHFEFIYIEYIFEHY